MAALSSAAWTAKQIHRAVLTSFQLSPTPMAMA
jgi:hypothetical protein